MPDRLAPALTRRPPATGADAADLADKYDQMLRLADLFDSAGEEMRGRAALGKQVLADEAVATSAELSPRTYRTVEEELHAAGGGKHGLLTRGVELDADALMVRATVLTYRWIDDLQEAAYKTLGSIAGRAIGYLAPEVALGGKIVAAGLIETDSLDRDDVATYLNELAANNPELMEHFTSGGGGLLDSLALRSMLTASVLVGDDGRAAAAGGQRASGIEPMSTDFRCALRDVAGGLLEDPLAPASGATEEGAAPRGLEGLMKMLHETERRIHVRRIAPHRYLALLPGPGARGLRLVGGDSSGYAGEVARKIAEAIGDDREARVLLAGAAQGGVTAAEVAAAEHDFVIDHVVTAGAPSAQVPRIPQHTRVLSLEDRSDPIALLGSLINAGLANRLTVVFDGQGTERESMYVAGGRAADAAGHPQLRAELALMTEAGYLAAV
jgi:hypothetical protein